MKEEPILFDPLLKDSFILSGGVDNILLYIARVRLSL
jgi:hypothetical protein